MNNSCVECNLFDPLLKCLNCDTPNRCHLCKDGYYLKEEGGQVNCADCRDFNCLLCSSSTNCTDCVETHFLENSICVFPVCGDGKIQGSEECDHGKGVDFDGCTDQCLIEDNFTCWPSHTVMYCSYTGDFEMSLLVVEK